MHFDERLLQWQPFFTTVATVAATLVGLLFVSLSLNREKIASAPDQMLLRLARRSFSDFLLVLLIALFFLIPYQGNTALAVELFGLGILRIRWLFLQLSSQTKREHKPTLPTLVREYMLPALAVIGILIAGAGIYRQELAAIYWFVVPVLAILLLRASWNAWLLLVLEQK